MVDIIHMCARTAPASSGMDGEADAIQRHSHARNDGDAPLPTHTSPGVACPPSRPGPTTSGGPAMLLGYFAMPSHPAGERPEGRPRLGPADAALARRTRLRRGLDRRALHRAVGTASLARPADRPGAAADETPAHRPRRLPAALPPPRRTRQPRGDAGPPVRGPAEFRRRRVGPADRLGDVQRRRHRPASTAR